MLQILRNKAQSYFIQAIVVIIALVFIFWGVGTRMMNKNQVAITINSDDISFQQFQKSFDQALSRLRDQFNGTIPQGLVEKIGIKQQVINRFIQDSLLRQGSSKMGLIISPAEVQDTIKKMAEFQDKGSFSLEKYKSVLTRNSYTAHKFETSIQSDLLSQRSIVDIGNFASMVTDQEIEDLYYLEKENVSVMFTKISPELFRKKIHITDEELSSWFETVKDAYKTDPQLKLKYLHYDFEDIGKKIAIDEETVKIHYDKNISNYTISEKRHARHILFKVDEDSLDADSAAQRIKAEDVLKLARTGKDFSQLAEKYSEGPDKTTGGDLGVFPKGKIIEPLDDAVFSMQPGDISEIIRTDFGYHIIKLEEIIPVMIKPLREVSKTIVQELQLEQAKSMAFQMANESYEGIIGAGSLEAYIKGHPEAAVVETDFFTRHFPPEKIKNDQTFLNTSFTLKQGELSSLIETTKGYAILFAEQIKEPITPPLAEIKDKVTKDYIDSKAAEMAKNTAEDILSQAKTGSDFIRLVQDAGLTSQSSGLLSKGNPEQKSPFPLSLLAQVFQLSAKSPFPSEPAEVDKEYFVYRFTERTTPKMDLSTSERNQYRNALLKLKQQQILTAWVNHQRKQAAITTHKSL
jgi:peptidyl-prolyl cis-trans isomerase D